MKLQLKPRYILVVAAAVLSFIAGKMEEKEEQKLLEAKVNQAIIDACVKVGMLEVDKGSSNAEA